MIVFAYGGTVNQYAAEVAAGWLNQLDKCPFCKTNGSLVGHGRYWRKPRDGQRAYRIAIQRWRCKSCGHTVSALPDFLLRYRWYFLEVVAEVLVARAEDSATWSELETTWDGAPVVRTMERWWQSFLEQAERWVEAIETTLAAQDSNSVWLDAQGEAAQRQMPAQVLLSAAGYLLAWGKTRWLELVDYGWKERLRFLWLWGSGQGLGRLV